MQTSRRSIVTLVRCTLAASAFVIAGSAHPASALVRTFMAVLNAGQEVPATASGSFGVGYFTFDTQTNMLCYSVTFSVADLLAPESDCHIHGPASPGVDGAIMFPVPLGNPKIGCVGPLGGPQRLALRKGELYINVHTTMHPGGEIRGQIVPTKGSY